MNLPNFSSGAMKVYESVEFLSGDTFDTLAVFCYSFINFNDPVSIREVPKIKNLNVEGTAIKKEYLEILQKKVVNRDRASASVVQEIIIAVMPAGKGSFKKNR